MMITVYNLSYGGRKKLAAPKFFAQDCTGESSLTRPVWVICHLRTKRWVRVASISNSIDQCFCNRLRVTALGARENLV